jgi:hypothetical protein
MIGRTWDANFHFKRRVRGIGQAIRTLTKGFTMNEQKNDRNWRDIDQAISRAKEAANEALKREISLIREEAYETGREYAKYDYSQGFIKGVKRVIELTGESADLTLILSIAEQYNDDPDGGASGDPIGTSIGDYVRVRYWVAKGLSLEEADKKLNQVHAARDEARYGPNHQLNFTVADGTGDIQF